MHRFLCWAPSHVHSSNSPAVSTLQAGTPQRSAGRAELAQTQAAWLGRLSSQGCVCGRRKGAVVKCFGKHSCKCYFIFLKVLNSVFHNYFSLLLNPLWTVWRIKCCGEMGSCLRISRQSMMWTPCILGKVPNSRKNEDWGDRSGRDASWVDLNNSPGKKR